jgi:hypothetical protein
MKPFAITSAVVLTLLLLISTGVSAGAQLSGGAAAGNAVGPITIQLEGAEVGDVIDSFVALSGRVG